MIERAEQEAQRHRGRLENCSELLDAPAQQARCYLDVLLKDGSLTPAVYDSTLAENTASHALATGRGSCAALVAVVLALTESLGEPFDAVVLREHVVLGSTALPEVFFEVLEEGRLLSEIDLLSHRQSSTG